jgi:predicted RNA-binding protein (virulence factor B family)
MIQTVEKLLFTRELAVILKSGVSLRDALISLSEQSQFSALRKVVDAIIADVENGQTLATAISRHPKVFDHLFVNLVMIGEETGSLPENMDFLAVQLEKKYQLKKKIQGILLYPAIVFLTATILAGLISVFILPKLVRLFNSFSVEKTAKAQAMIASLTREYKVGEIVEGPVIKILDFGAIVDLGGGKDGMVHVSELKEGFVKQVSDVVKVGDFLRVKIIRVEDGHIGLSLKRMGPTD